MAAGILQRCRAYGAGRTRFSFDSPPPVRFHPFMPTKANVKKTGHAETAVRVQIVKDFKGKK
jgi:hypothetical protein